MADCFLTHDTFVLERTYSATPARVFAAWSDPAAKRAWFLGDETGSSNDYQLEFRVGGREFTRSEVEGDVYTYDARYEDIVDDRRVVYSSYMLRGDTRISVSVTSVEFQPDGGGTALVLTEHGIYLDGHDKPEYRVHGVGVQLDALGSWLSGS